MGSANAISPSSQFRKDLRARGGDTAARCYQCATCSSVCMLASAQNMFPRRQMLWAQWGLGDKLAADPGVWLCHQCNDCSERCPRDAKPGDVMQSARAMMIEKLSVPTFMGRLVANAATTWWLLLGVPVLFWVLLVAALNGFAAPEGPLVYGDVVPHWLIYAVYFPAFGLGTAAALAGGKKAWKLWGQGVERKGSFLNELTPAIFEVLSHKRFASCGTAKGRRWGHFFLFWGFVGAAVTSFFIVVAMYGFAVELPVPQTNWMKILGNISALLLLVGGVWVLANRLRDGSPAGTSHAFDNFFLGIVLLLIATGIVTEGARYFFPAELAIAIYILHLGTVLTVFLTFPYSKFSHLMYRTLAMVHERMAVPATESATESSPQQDRLQAAEG